MTAGDGRRTCLVRTAEGQVATLSDADLGKVDELRAQHDTVVWLDLESPDDDDLGLISEEFAIHPLAMEDVQKRGQRPKLDTYPEQHMLVVYEATEASEAERNFDLAELHLFAGPGWLISVHWDRSPAIESVRGRFTKRVESVGRTVAALLYAILDAATDSYFPVLDGLSDRIDRLEDRVLEGESADTGGLREMLAIKREGLELRRVLAPMRDLANALLRRDQVLIDDATAPYYQDLFDHILRLLDQLDLYRDLMAAVLDARLNVASNNLNAIMKRLTAFTVILMVPTLIAGIYGMNFDFMPELHWALGYPIALGLMAAAAVSAIAFFRSRGWF